MSRPEVVAVAPASPAARAGVRVGDEIRTLDGQVPRDVLQYRELTDGSEIRLELDRDGVGVEATVTKRTGEPLGLEVDSSIFDQVRTCDNHCEFCFIYQLPPGMRRSLYLKDDDYRLSFLYGNFTTLTRFTEADLERVVTEGLAPLYVSIHATDPDVRAHLLRNRRGGTSLRWLRALLDHGVEVHGQIVVCPGVNDGAVLDQTLCGVLDRYPELASLAVVPLGVSRFNDESRMRAHRRTEAVAVVELVERWQGDFLELLGHRMAYAADEYYLLADRPLPAPTTYGEFPMYEDGIGMIRCFEEEFGGRRDGAAASPGFFGWVDGAPAEGYRAPRTSDDSAVTIRQRDRRPVAVLTGTMAAPTVADLVAGAGRSDARVVTVPNDFFGGNIGVAGLMVGEDVARVLERQPTGHRYLLPDVCLSGDRFLDGRTPADLPRPVEVIATDGRALREALRG